MRRLQSEMNRLFDDSAPSHSFPAVNLWQGRDSVAVTAELPGLSSEDIQLSVTEDTLTIAGERRAAADGEHVSWYRRERPEGRFSRTIELPFRVDPNKVEARFTNGVLEIEMHRPEADLPRRIEIRTS